MSPFPKINILAIAVHPDDAELSCSGTLARHKALGYTTGILDLSGGELGTRGSKELRLTEAADSAKILNLDFRKTLDLRDGFFKNDEYHQLAIIQWLRALQPDVVLCNAPEDRHPDHGRAGALAVDACFYSGLRKIETEMEGIAQSAWRPAKVYHYIQDRFIQPSLVVDISPYMDIKLQSIRAFTSQFYNPGSDEPETYISSASFFENISARARTFGHMIGTEFGEGFVLKGPVRVGDMMGEIE